MHEGREFLVCCEMDVEVVWNRNAHNVAWNKNVKSKRAVLVLRKIFKKSEVEVLQEKHVFNPVQAIARRKRQRRGAGMIYS